MNELLIIIQKIIRCRIPPSFLFKTREEISKEVYIEYWKLKNRENYLKRQDAKFGLLPFSSFDEDGHFVENIPDESVYVPWRPSDVEHTQVVNYKNVTNRLSQ